MKKTFTLFCLALLAAVGFNANADVWMMGHGNFGGWTPNAPLEMQTDDNNVWYVTVEAAKGNYFTFIDQKGTSSSDWSCNTNGHRFGPTTNSANPTGEWEATKTGDLSWLIATAGTYKCEFRVSDKMARITLQEETPEEPFDADKLQWAATGLGVGGWDMPPVVIFEKQDDGSHVAFVEAAVDGFKIAGLKKVDGIDWAEFDTGVYGTTQALVEGDNTLTAGVTSDMTMPVAGYVTLTVKNVTETSCVLTIEKTGEIEKPDPKEAEGVFVIGHVNGSTQFLPSQGYKLEAKSETLYEGAIEITDVSEGKGWITLAGNLADFDDQSGWDQIRAIRMGVPGETENEVVSADALGTALTWEYGCERSFELAAGYYNISVDLSAKTVTFTAGEEPTPELYILGHVLPVDDWLANQGVAMTLVEGKKFTATIEASGRVDGKSYFSFTTALADVADDWDAIASRRFGANAVKGSENDYVLDADDFGATLTLAKNGAAYCVEGGKYEVTVDLDALTCVISKVEGGNVLDVTGDGSVNVGDVNYVLGLILNEAYESKADVNGDGAVNVGDVNAILAYILEHA